jgi:hypothetical protein
MIENKSHWLERKEILEAKKEKHRFENVQKKLPESVEIDWCWHINIRQREKFACGVQHQKET